MVRLGRAPAFRSLIWLLGLAASATALVPTGCSARAPQETIGTTSAAESRDTFGLGEGRSGALSVTTPNTVVNTYAPVVAVGSSTSITVGPLQGAAGALAPGDLLMIWRVGGLAAASASQVSFLLDSDIGGYEFGRVKTVTASGANTVVTFTNALGTTTRYATASQVVRIPEYTTVAIAASTSVTPYAWDGSCGGIVAFLATGTVTNAGSVLADGMGFRGGPVENATVVVNAPNCSSHDGNDEASPCGGAHKGEGIDTANYSATPTTLAAAYGFGNYANGAGGGDARNSGGGGGGGFGLGGNGGNTVSTDMTRNVGGLGGAPLSYDPSGSFLELGGGGGAGDEDHGTGTAGGAGGGVILVRAGVIAGNGVFSAQGQSVTATAGTDGSGGGGAGGAVVLFSAGTARCATASANGGAGGSGGSEPDGPGGGGGGGIVFVEASSVGCVVTATGGSNGTTTASLPNGAGMGAVGTTMSGIGAAYGGGACSPTALAKDLCGGCVVDADCAPMVCDTTSNVCAPCTATEQGSCTGTTSACSAVAKDGGGTFACVACNGDFGSLTATAPCLSSVTPHCVATGASAGTCGACLTGTDCPTAGSPACSSVSFTCVVCNGDMGTTATAPCPASAAPYCQAAGTCGLCTMDSDCGAGHAGPRCDTTTGACGATCTTDAICGAGDWCDNLTTTDGVCQAQIPNGQPVTGGSCTAAIGARACVSGVCSTTDNDCGLPDGATCAAGDAAAGETACRSGICATTGANAGKCEACASDKDCSGTTPVCSPTTSTCVGCTTADSASCKGDRPVCDTTTNTCAACTGDVGTKATLPCSANAAAPFCSTTGACTTCVNNADCDGPAHLGPICDNATGTCGSACTADGQCNSGEWCTNVDDAPGVCKPKLANGAPLPTSPAGLSKCTLAIAERVCASGTCDPHDNECGPGTSGDAGVFHADGSLPNSGTSIEGGAFLCATSGPGSGRPGESGTGLGLFGLALAAASIARRRQS